MQVKCANCRKDYQADLKVRPLPDPYKDVSDVYIQCPHCGVDRHTHYLSPIMLQKQVQLRSAIIRHKTIKSNESFLNVLTVKRAYGALFDTEQEKYKNFLKKVASQNGITA